MTRTPTEHTLRSFDAALANIDRDFQSMGNTVVEMTANAVAATVKQDRHLALSVVETDLDVDRAFEDLRAACFDTILRFQPVARDLRQVMSIEHAVGDLERIGDHAKNIAKGVIEAQVPGEVDADGRLSAMGNLVVATVRDVLHAMAARESVIANRVIAGDAKIDALNASLFDAILVDVADGSGQAETRIRQLFTCKALERIGDHATNIAEEVLFLTRGVPAGATRSDMHG